MNLLLTPSLEFAEAFPDVPDGFEMVDGELAEKNVGTQSSYVGGRLFHLLSGHCGGPGQGWAFPGDAGYHLFPGQRKLLRKPDVSFVRPGRFPGGTLPLGDMRFAPDLAAEVVSPNDLYDEVDRKVAEYREAGVALIWVVSPQTRTVLIRRRDGTVSEVGPDGELSGEDVVPGFHCRVSDLFPLAEPAEPPELTGAP